KDRRLELVHRVAESLAPRGAETMFVRINRVERAVNECDFEIHERVAGDCTAGRGLDDALLNRGAELLRHCAAENLVLELEAAAARQRLEDDLAVAELPAPARLFLVPPLHLRARRDRLLVRHFRRMQSDLDVKTVL